MADFDLEALKAAALASLKNRKACSVERKDDKDEDDIEKLRRAALRSRANKVVCSNDTNEENHSSSKGSSNSGIYNDSYDEIDDDCVSEISILEEVDEPSESELQAAETIEDNHQGMPDGIPDLLRDSFSLEDLLDDDIMDDFGGSIKHRNEDATKSEPVSIATKVSNQHKEVPRSKNSKSHRKNDTVKRRSPQEIDGNPRDERTRNKSNISKSNDVVISKSEDTHRLKHKGSRPKHADQTRDTKNSTKIRDTHKDTNIDSIINKKYPNTKLRTDLSKIISTEIRKSAKQPTTKECTTADDSKPHRDVIATDPGIKKSLKERLGGFAKDKQSASTETRKRRRVSLDRLSSSDHQSVEESPPHNSNNHDLQSPVPAKRPAKHISRTTERSQSNHGESNKIQNYKEMSPKTKQEKDLDEKIRKIKEKNAKILQRQKEIEREKALYG